MAKRDLNLKPGETAVIDPNAPALGLGGAPQSDDQKKLRRLIERRHPKYHDFCKHWDFLEATYNGGREWFEDGNIFRYVKEGDGEFKDRVERAYRFNHSREVVDLLNKYLFKQHITRSEDAPESVKRFWKRATKRGLNVDDFVRQASKKASIYGRIAVVVDNPPVAEAKTPLSKADEKKLDLTSYAYVIPPKQILDFSLDERGTLNWILLQEVHRDDADPMESDGEVEPRWRLWDKQGWQLYREEGSGKRKRVVLVSEGEHGLGRVPVILHDNIISDEEWVTPALIDDIAYLDRAVANYLSNLDAIIQDQTFSQLAMPAQNVLPGSDSYKTLVEMGTKRTFLYDGEGGGKPEYLSPDPKQAGVILSVISKIINEIYHTVGLAGERTKEDNSVGIDNSSGVAKAYDFERVNALLQAKADSLQALENQIVELVAAWGGEDKSLDADKDYVSYPDNFDTRSLYDEFDIAARLQLIDAPDMVRRQQMESVIEKMFPQLKKELLDKMKAELQDWPVDPIDFAAAMTTATTPADKPMAPPAKSPAGQGSVQKNTK